MRRHVVPVLVASMAFAGCGGGGGSVPPNSPPVVRSPTPTPAPTPTPTPMPTPTPPPGGGITIIIPPPEPVICTPSPVTLGIAQRIVVTCASAGYTGPITFTIDNPAIADVELVAGTYTLYYVAGLQPGTATVTFATTSGGTGQLVVTVVQ